MKYEPMNEQMSQISHLPWFVCQMYFKCIILVHETYELWMNKFYMISITKLWDVKFVMILGFFTFIFSM
jgi:hypothetical protein